MRNKEKLRILQLIASNDPGGAETVVRDLSLLFRKGPVQCDVGLAGGGWLAKELKENGSAHKTFNYRPFIDLRLIKQVCSYILENKIDLVQCHMSQMNLLGTLICRFLKIPVVMTIHGMTNDFDSPKQVLLYRFATKFCDKIVAVSNHLKQEFLKNVPVRNNKIKVIHNGVMEGEFGSTEWKNDRNDDSRLKIVAIGNLLAVKDYHTLIKSCAVVRKKCSDFTVDIVGDGPERDNLGLLVTMLDLEEHVHLIGFRENVREILETADVYVMSSKHEGFSISTLEAMSAGLPVIATKCGGPEEIVVDSETGFLIEKGDCVALAGAIECLIFNPELRAELGRRGKKRTSDMFSLSRMRQKYEVLYRDVWSHYGRSC